MIGNLKVKIRGAKEEPVRRIRTEMNENTKKSSFYQPTRGKLPLQEHKKCNNQSDTITLKRPKPVKSIALKHPASKLHTEAKDKDILSHAHKAAIERIFHKQGPSLSLHRREQPDSSNRLSGAARYQMEDKVGSGTFGVVHKARDKKTLEIVAIKRVYQDKKYKNRELQILKGLNHPNVLKIRDSFFTYQGDKEYLSVVMDYFPCNLYQSIQKYRNKGEMSKLKLKVLAFQMFKGLLYLQQIGIAHRDMKPQNVLVNDTNWKLIICDFGSAKRLIPGEPNLAYICSRCYRAPELIFGSTDYNTQIDMWSAGCIMAEMVSHQPIFRSESNIDQLVEIIKVLGTPSFDDIMEMNPDCDIEKYQFPKIGSRAWEKVLKKKFIGSQFYDLLGHVLRYSPKKRFTPCQALAHPFFDQLRDKEVFMKLKKEYQVGTLFEFERGVSSGVVPQWWR